MSDYQYEGGELPLFAEAHRWKAYIRRLIGWRMKGEVLEVGAGLGAVTAVFRDADVRRWVCLEPDASPHYVHSAEEERQILRDMERAGVRHVVVGPEMFPNTGIDKLPVLSEHLRRCYAEAAAEGQYRFLDQKSCP